MLAAMGKPRRPQRFRGKAGTADFNHEGTDPMKYPLLVSVGLLAACTTQQIVTVETDALPCALAIQAAVAGANSSDNVSKAIAAATAAGQNQACLGLATATVQSIEAAVANGKQVAAVPAAAPKP